MSYMFPDLLSLLKSWLYVVYLFLLLINRCYLCISNCISIYTHSQDTWHLTQSEFLIILVKHNIRIKVFLWLDIKKYKNNLLKTEKGLIWSGISAVCEWICKLLPVAVVTCLCVLPVSAVGSVTAEQWILVG